MKKKKRIRRILFLLIVLVILGIIVYNVIKSDEDNSFSIINKEPVVDYEAIRLENIDNCYNDSTLEFSMSDDFNNRLNQLQTKNGVYSLNYEEVVEDKTFINYNGSKLFYGESIVKLPLAIYIYELALNDPSILTKELMYDSSFYKGGSGVMQNMDKSRPFTVKELVKYLIEESDNIAFFMLLSEFNKYDAQKYWFDLGATSTFTGTDNFGYLTGNDTLIYLNKLYEIIESNNPHYEELINNTLNASYISIIKENINKDLYFKYGGPTVAYHEMGIVNTDKPYIITVLTDISSVDYKSLIGEISVEVDSLHNLYWEEKMTYCESSYPKENTD